MNSVAAHEPLERIYVWEWPVRLSHWLIGGSMVVLATTGIYIGNPFLQVSGQATWHFAMGTIKSIHFVAAMLFAVSVLARILWMFTGNVYARWHQFLPVTARRIRGIWQTFAFYTFLRRDSPAHVGHNPLAGATYTIVFCLYTLMIVTGLALASASAHIGSMLHAFGFLIPWLGGLQLARFLHHIGMWLLVGFVAHHVWSAVLVDLVEKSGEIDSIFSGYKTLPPDVAKRAERHVLED
jgi:Ni/Fe-hydrogenase 1 B-type cytochrome subunit